MYPSYPHGRGKLALTRRRTRARPRHYAVCLPREQRPEVLAVRSFSCLWHLHTSFMLPYQYRLRPPISCSPWLLNSLHVVIEIKREHYFSTITQCHNGSVRGRLATPAARGVGAVTQGRAAARCACSIARVCSRRCTHWAASAVSGQSWLRREIQGITVAARSGRSRSARRAPVPSRRRTSAPGGAAAGSAPRRS